MYRLIKTLAVLLFLAAPLHIVQAAPPNFKALMYQLTELIDLGTFALFSLAVAYFFISVVRNLWGSNSGDAEKKKKLQESLVWGIVVLFVMVSIWGIIQILQITLSRGLG